MRLKILVWTLGMAFGIIFAAGCIQEKPGISDKSQLKKFSSYEELENFIKTNSEMYKYYGDFYGYPETARAPMAIAPATKSADTVGVTGASKDYSTTNIQVAGVDEADIVKNDGKYIYVVSGDRIVILDAYPAEEGRILSETKFNGTPREIFINKDKLVVFGQESYNYPSKIGGPERGLIAPYYSSRAFIYVYDVSDRENPVITRNISLDGNYFNSRMIGDYVYVIINQPMSYYEDELRIPNIYYGDEVKSMVDYTDIYYFDVVDYSYQLTTILAINTQDDNEEPSNKVVLMGTAQNMYVSLNNIYVTYMKRFDLAFIEKVIEKAVPVPREIESEKTIIHKISIDNGKIEYKASGEVPGQVLNQFSMDEYNGYFRIATTIGHVSRAGGGTENNIYVLDDKLEIAGKVENLAPGERIYSARFMGDRAYLVTFRKVDPLFVIDLKDPNNPEVLGKLKIPGYSDYLHPYDENHIIGLGKEAVEAEQGDFSWYQGVKLAIFDVSDVSTPKEIAKYEIGDRGTESYALHDHKAFLFSKSKNLLVIPILLAEINEEQYPTGVPPNMRGDYTFQGAYVFDVSLDNGFNLKGRITHVEDDTLMKSGYYFNSPYSVKRSLYIDGVLYTLSDKMIKMNELDDLAEINKIELSYEGEDYYPIYR